MEEYKKVVKQQDGISSYKITTKGHFVLESQYMDISARLKSNSMNNIEFGSFLTYISLYDALRSPMSQYVMLAQFYKVLSKVKSDQELAELKAGLDELKGLGGVINQIYPMLAANLNSIGIANANMLHATYEKMYQAEQSKAKSKTQNQNKQSAGTDGDAKPDVGAKDINNVADKTARTVENANGVDSALEDNYKLHIPSKTTDDLYPHLKRIKLILKHYDNNRQQVYIDELKRELFNTFEEMRRKEELEALEEVMESFASQGEAGRDFFRQYQIVKENYADRLRAKESEFEEFKDMYNKIMREFEEFEDDKRRGNIDSDNIDSLVSHLRRVEDRLEANKQYLNYSQYSKYAEELEERIHYLRKLQEQLDDINRGRLF